MDRLYLLMMGGAPILSALLGTMVLTRLICRLTMGRFRPLRLLPLVLLAIPLMVAVNQYLIKNRFWELGMLYSGAVGGAILLGWLAGWRRCRRKERA